MDTGTKVYRNYFPIKFGWQSDCKYGICYPCFRKMMYPGDVFKINADLLIRYQPMMTPPMNDCIATVRFAFVPLRLLEENTELIVTGSKDGKLYTETIPTMDSVFKYLDVSTKTKVEKGSTLDLLYGIPKDLVLNTSGLLDKLDKSKSSPAAYFAKAMYRFWWDYYRDENLFSQNDFETYWQIERQHLHDSGYFISAELKKDRITSALPWQLKAISAPKIELYGTATMTPNYDDFINNYNASGNEQLSHMRFITNSTNTEVKGVDLAQYVGSSFSHDSDTKAELVNEYLKDYLNQQQSVTIQQLGFDAAQFRDMMAQTRIFERLARCGSRYTEYLRANFGIAPADGTLQRSQYLGGFKTRIVTTEVVQTAGDGDNPVGTLRGHGITHGSSTIKPFMAREIGVIIGLLDIKPETIYAQGVDRELTYRSRFDFLNPSFQHLSEQEVRKGEVYFNTDTNPITGNLVNDETWGFQPYAQELRTGIKHVVGDMRDSLSYWNQALIFSSRPQLNHAFIKASNHLASYNRPFVVQSSSSAPMIVDFGGIIEAYRPLVKNGTPGLVDHN